MIENRFLRRSVTIPVTLAATVLVTAALPVLLAAALAVDGVRRARAQKPAMAMRLLAFLWLYLLGESAAVVCLGVVTPLETRRRVAATYRLQAIWARWLLAATSTIFGLRFDVSGDDRIPPPPLIVLSRHASIIDTLLPAAYITHRHGIALRYVLKKELLVDPALDLAGNRLPNHFVDRGSRHPDRETAAIRDLAAGMGEDEGVMIYPEGTRYSDALRRRLVERAVAAGGVPGEVAAGFERVLPPRPAGTLALLDGSTADVVVLAHRGLEAFARVRDVWEGGLVGARVDVRFWRVPRHAVPDGRAAQVEWLFRLWGEVDDWVREGGSEAIDRAGP